MKALIVTITAGITTVICLSAGETSAKSAAAGLNHLEGAFAEHVLLHRTHGGHGTKCAFGKYFGPVSVPGRPVQLRHVQGFHRHSDESPHTAGLPANPCRGTLEQVLPDPDPQLDKPGVIACTGGKVRHKNRCVCPQGQVEVQGKCAVLGVQPGKTIKPQ